jgi:predicted Zn-dependent peptidase
MKKLYIILLTICIGSVSFAQVDRSKLPEPAPAREIEIGDYETFTLKNGLQVFVVENHKLPRVSFSLVLDREPIVEGDKAGYTSMVGQMLRRGTSTRTKEQLDEEIDFIGASLGASSTSIFGSSLTKHKEKMLELMTDMLYNSTFPEAELDKIKTQTLSGLASQKDDPDAISGNVSTVLVYGKSHPYGELVTEETVGNITIDDIKNYYSTYFKPNIAYLAIVGDINKKDTQKLVKKLFGKWEKGDVPKPVYDLPQPPEKSFVAMVDKSSAVQSVVNITYPIILKPGTPDVVKARVLNQIFGGGSSARLFVNLREDKAYTYGAYSSISSDKLVGEFSAGASVRNEVTDSAIVQFNYEMNRMRTELVSQEELDLAISSISGSFARSLERPQTVASFAINTARYNLPENYYSTYLKRVQAVNISDVQQTAEKYIHPDNAYITVVGKAGEVAKKLTAFGDVKYFDIYGNEYVPSDSPNMPAGQTAEKVIDSYLNAIGGKEKLAAIKDLTIESKAELQGQPLTIKVINKAPNLSYQTILMGGAMELQKSIYDGKNFAQFMQGNKAPNDENGAMDAPIKGQEISELHYLALGAKLELKGIEKVNESDAYVIEVTLPSGAKTLEYFDFVSGLKLRSTQFMQGPQGEVAMSTDYKDYKEFDGIMFPYVTVIPLGGAMKLEAKVESIKINSGVVNSIFKIE